MKAVKLYSLFLLVICSCISENNKNVLTDVDSDSLNAIPQTNTGENIFEKDSIIDGTSQLSFKFNIDSSGAILNSIFVYLKSNKVQEIIVNKKIDNKEFQLVDWNFDGYKDISVKSNCGSGGCTYWIWDYIPKRKTFFYNKELSDRIGLEIDTISKYIIFHYRAGYSEENWDSFQYQNNKLLFVKGLLQERWNDLNGQTWIKRTKTKMINNKSIITVDSNIIK